jgi:hypothetical protein
MRWRMIAEVFQIAHLLFEALERGPKPDLGMLTNYEESVVKRQVRMLCTSLLAIALLESG